MKLITKMIVPVVVLLVVAFGALSGISFYFEKQLINESILNQTTSKVNEAVDVLKTQEEEMKLLKEELNTTYIDKAKMLTLMISEKPSIIESKESIANLLQTLGVEEIHVCDENGIIRWGSVPEFIGFDFSSSEQTKPFLPALTDKNFQLAQEPTERGADKVLFQYVGVARQDKPGLVQIGLKPERLQQELAKADIKEIGRESVLGKEGYVFIANKETGEIISHKSDSLLGKTLSELGLSEKMNGKENGNFFYTLNGVNKFMSFKTVDNYIIGAIIPENEFTAGLKKLLINIVVISLLSLILSGLIIYILIRVNIIKEMKKLLAVLKLIGEGNLKQKADVKSSLEFKEFSDGINSMAESLRDLISRNKNLTGRLEDAADKLAESADQTSKGAEEIATTINELAQGANEQADSATKGALLAKEALSKLEIIAENINDTVVTTGSTKSSVEDGMKIISFQSDKMEKNAASTVDVNNAVAELAGKANEIGNIINVITGIANQTNMLALNAAIEAARAGEAGKGFAVVADEVRKLAEDSTISAQKISEIINEIQNSIGRVREQSASSLNAVGEQQAAVAKTKEAFVKIKEDSDAVVSQIEMISQSTSIVVKAVEDMVQVMEITAASSQQSAAGTEEISASTEEQSASIEEVAQIAKELANMVEELDTLSSHFTI